MITAIEALYRRKSTVLGCFQISLPSGITGIIQYQVVQSVSRPFSQFGTPLYSNSADITLFSPFRGHFPSQNRGEPRNNLYLPENTTFRLFRGHFPQYTFPKSIFGV